MMHYSVGKTWMKKCMITVAMLGFISCFPFHSSQATEVQNVMKIRVEANGQTTVFELNNSTAAKELYAQLPLDIAVEDYGGLEKIFYPPQKLNTAGTQLVSKAQPGTLAYYAPWGDVVMFYKRFGAAAGLYELGQATSGEEQIQELSGTLRISRDEQ